jgi:hypothetical protein
MPATVVQTGPIRIITGVQSSTVAFASNVAAGNKITVKIAAYNASGAPTISSVTDTLSNPYSEVVQRVSVNSENVRAALWVGEVVTGGACTVTVNLSAASSDLTFIATEVRGINLPAHASNSADGASQAPSVSVTTTVADTFLVGAFTHSSSNRSLTEGAGFSLIAENEGGSSNMPLLGENKSVSATGVQTIEGAIGTASAVWTIVGAAFEITPLLPRRPVADISTGGWTAVPSGTLASTMDETTTDDADYARSGANPVNDVAEVDLENISTPGAGDIQIIVRHRTEA